MTSQPGAGDQPGPALPLPVVRYLPAVTFGLRAAALAGMAVSVSGIAGLGDVFDTDLAFYTTCCAGEEPEIPN